MGTIEKMQNLANGFVRGLRDLLLEFWDPLYITGVVEARNSKFSTHIDHESIIGKIAILRKWGS